MKKMDIIRKGELVGVLLSFLLISCENSTTSSEDSSDKLFLSFDMRLPVDGNNYYHLDINRNTWQTLHRVSARIETSEGDPVEFFWMEWESDLYWYFGDKSLKKILSPIWYVFPFSFNDMENIIPSPFLTVSFIVFIPI